MRKKKILKILNRHISNYEECINRVKESKTLSFEKADHIIGVCLNSLCAISLVRNEIINNNPIDIVYSTEDEK